jgi:hypothetical protein
LIWFGPTIFGVSAVPCSSAAVVKKHYEYFNQCHFKGVLPAAVVTTGYLEKISRLVIYLDRIIFAEVTASLLVKVGSTY